mmetsp:Transcript_65484/g.191633  ORF Transcript_65484/g.191633 Transcript_65484/m.191633 type:complete len:270 (+) Transcript_65484:349-1158(+)
MDAILVNLIVAHRLGIVAQFNILAASLEAPPQEGGEDLALGGDADLRGHEGLQLLHLCRRLHIKDQRAVGVRLHPAVLPDGGVAHGGDVDVQLKAPDARLGDEARGPVLKAEAHPVHVELCEEHVIIEVRGLAEKVDVLHGHVLLVGDGLPQLQDRLLRGEALHHGVLRELRGVVDGPVRPLLHEPDPDGLHDLGILGLLELCHIHLQLFFRGQGWVLVVQEVLGFLVLLSHVGHAHRCLCDAVHGCLLRCATASLCSTLSRVLPWTEA